MSTVSMSPVPATTPVMLDWAGACEALLAGKRVRRSTMDAGWYLTMRSRFLHVVTPTGVHSLQVSDEDMTAADWSIVEATTH